MPSGNKDILICGGRNYGRKWDYSKQRYKIDIGQVRKGLRIIRSACEVYSRKGIENITLVNGQARGADALAEAFVRWIDRNPQLLRASVSARNFPADWNRYKKRAGIIRNQEMLDENDISLTIAFEGGAGTEDMIRRSLKNGIKTIHYSEGKLQQRRLN